MYSGKIAVPPGGGGILSPIVRIIVINVYLIMIMNFRILEHLGFFSINFLKSTTKCERT
jgi:hypothetical protein